MTQDSPASTSTPHAWLRAAALRCAGARAERIPAALPEDITAAWSLTLKASGVTVDALVAAAFAETSRPAADLTHCERRALKLLPERFASRMGVLPVRLDGDALIVAAANPFDLAVEADVAFASGRKVVLSPQEPALLRAQINAEYSPERAIDDVVSGFGHGSHEVSIEEDVKLSPTPTTDPTGAVRRLAATLLRDAVVQGASDIHLEPVGTLGSVRYRLDGIMQPVLTMPGAVYARVVSRLKVIGGLDVADARRPQDGRSRVTVDGVSVDLRIASLPLESGAERLVIRLLAHTAITSLDALDLVEPERAQLLRLMDLTDGLVLMTGPTGSGKTTTLHAALQRRLSSDITIMTVEDPVEFRITGISQVQVEPKAGLTFASALRALLRQDPDIVLVGEIRDSETAETATQAAMTGRLILSTVHTDDAPGALVRLRDLGVRMDSIAETVRGAVAQRLLRRLCPQCGVEPEPSALTEDEMIFAERVGSAAARRAVGCAQCAFTGYRGRLPIHQVFLMTERIKQLLMTNAALDDIRAAAREDGMRSLGESAATRIRAGDTTIAEALRVLGEGFWSHLEHAAPAADSEATVAVKPLTPHGATPDAPDSIVVLAEDPLLRQVLQSTIATLGLTVFSAATAADAVRFARDSASARLMVIHAPDAHLTPSAERRERIIALRRAIGDLALPVIMIVSTLTPALEQELAAFGVDDCLIAPVDAELLIRRARAALRRSTAHDVVPA